MEPLLPLQCVSPTRQPINRCPHPLTLSVMADSEREGTPSPPSGWAKLAPSAHLKHPLWVGGWVGGWGSGGGGGGEL
jgi:hypothetical protein